MKHLITLALVVFATIGTAAAQKASTTGAQQSSPSRDNGWMPISSPEPITMLALAGGSAAAIGLVRRRRKNK